MPQIKINGRETTLPQSNIQSIIEAIREVITKNIPGIGDVMAVQIITEKKREIEILTGIEKKPPNKIIESPSTEQRPSLAITADQPIQGILPKDHPCYKCAISLVKDRPKEG